MPGFDALYRQTVTLFNRVRVGTVGNEVDYFIPTVLEKVHLVIDQSATWNGYGGSESDNVRLHVRYVQSGSKVLVGHKQYCEPKEWKRLQSYDGMMTFRFGNDTDFDFFISGVFVPDPEKTVSEITIGEKTITLDEGFINDAAYGKFGFYSYLNKMYDHVFAVTAVAQYNLIPHFEIMSR